MRISKPKAFAWLSGLLFLCITASAQQPADDPRTVYVNCATIKSRITVPEIEAYDRIKPVCLTKSFFSLHYSSEFVSTIDLLIQKTGKSFAVKGIMWYVPCQTCEDGRTEVYTFYPGKPLAYFQRVDVLDYTAKNAPRKIYTGTAGYYNIRFQSFVRKLLPGYQMKLP